MQTFATGREAKEFLVDRVVEEAEREGVSLSEVEQKMLYFSETGWSLPDIREVSDRFDGEYSQADYEEKIATLIRNLCARDRRENQGASDAWKAAVNRLRQEDHYLLVMINASPEVQGASDAGTRRILKLLGVAVLVAVILVALLGYLSTR